MLNQLTRKLTDVQFAVLDTETSLVSTAGSSAFYDMVEIACMAASIGGNPSKIFQSLIKPYYPFNAPSCKATHINNAVLSKAPAFSKVVPDLIPLFRGRVVVGQNTQFDIRVLKMAIEKYHSIGQLSPAQKIELTAVADAPHLDTKKLFGQLFPDETERSLDVLATHLGLEIIDRKKHEAADDVQLTWRAFERMVRLLDDKGVRTLNELFEFQNGTFGRPRQRSLF